MMAIKVAGWITHRREYLNNKLLRNIGSLGLANIIYAAARWGVIVVSTKLGGVGITSQLAIGLAVVVPVMTLTGSGLRAVVTSDVTRNNSFGQYLITRIIINLLGLLGVCLFSSVSGYRRETFYVILLLGLTKYIEGLQEICWGIAQRHEVMGQVGVSKILRETGMVFLVGVGLYFTKNLLLSISLWLIWWIIIFLIYDLPKAKALEQLNFGLAWEPIKSITVKSFPLAILWAVLAFNEKIGQYLISWMQSEQAVGYYAPLSYFLQVGSLGFVAVSEAFLPRLAGWFRTDNKKFYINGMKLAGIGAFIGFIMFLTGLIVGKSLLMFFYSPEYLNYYDVFLVLMATSIFRYAFDGFGRALTAAGVYWSQIPTTISSLVVTTVLGFYAIPRFGLMGAALATAAATIISLVLFLIVFVKLGRKDGK